MDTPAWQSLSLPARCGYVEVCRRYNGNNNGRIGLGVRELGAALDIGRSSAARILDELQDRGFIALTSKGNFKIKVRLATEWRITEHGSFEGIAPVPATKDFFRWTGGGSIWKREEHLPPKRPPAGTRTPRNGDGRGDAHRIW
jgi:hypothetical protein